MAYATIAELKASINILTTDATRDTVLTRLLSAAEEAINGICNRPDGFLAITTATARYFPGSGKSYQRIDECVAVTAVAVKDSPSDDENAYTAWVLGTVGTTTAADVFLASGDPKYPNFGQTPYTLLVIGPNGSQVNFTSGRFASRGGFRPTADVYRGLPTVKVTARYGYSDTVPPQVKEACVLQASRWYKRGESSYADTLGSAEMGILQFRKALDPDLEAMLVLARLVKPAIGRR